MNINHSSSITLSRFYAIQALYQYYISGQSIEEVREEFYLRNNKSSLLIHADWHYFEKIIYLVVSKEKEILSQLVSVLKVSPQHMNLLNLIILKLAYSEIFILKEDYEFIVQEYKKHAYNFGTKKCPSLIAGVMKALKS
jgi:transcription termination factor NusB